jgi:membrane protease YdiL (CAAX protease family)
MPATVPSAATASATASPRTPAVLRPFRRYPLTAFFLLACFFGWMPYWLAALGIGADPSNNPFGPLVAVCIVAACQGRAQLTSWGRSLLRWRARPIWYATAFLAPIGIVVASVGANALLGASLPTAEQLGNGSRPLLAFLFMLLAVGLGEEVGWTAFAAPVLLRRHSFPTAFVVLAAMRFFWHLPLMLSGELPWVAVASMLSFQLMLLMLLASGGPWTLGAVWHASQNAFGGVYFFQMVAGPDKARLGVLMGLVYVLAAAASVLWVVRRRPATTSASARTVPGPDSREGVLLQARSGGGHG